ncbi:uncharacterized protein LOC136074442 [Hydra vulgaris]|uniref:ATP-dependent DNA helicase n=1 Tax=Hydra vulgaris TaxID=6087 RepID=A0ABM4B238_HYDVU
MTIHAFAGIKTGVKGLDYYMQHMHPDVKKRWLETDVLIIDKISMINAQTFDMLLWIACRVKQCNDELFGGIQVIACRDFLQLSPVKECFRQKKDAKFFEALNEIRFVKVSDQTIDYFITRHFNKDENNKIKYTRLFFLNIEVDVYNAIKMTDIRNEECWFHAKDVIKNPNNQFTFQIPAAIHHCSHAIVASRVWLPLRLAFSFTVHKAQGSTMNKAVINFDSNAFNNTLYYVSLSQYKTEESKFSNNSVYRKQFYYIEDGCKDEDIVEELELNAKIQSSDEIVFHVEQKTL